MPGPSVHEVYVEQGVAQLLTDPDPFGQPPYRGSCTFRTWQNSMRKYRRKLALLAEFGSHCFYCQVPFSALRLSEVTVDHYIPKDGGGRGLENNTRPACLCCNRAKSNLHPTRFTPPGWEPTQLWGWPLSGKVAYPHRFTTTQGSSPDMSGS